MIEISPLPKKDGWNGAHARFSSDPSLSPDQVAEAHAALDWFEQILGKNWSGWSEGRPLASHFRAVFGAWPCEGVRLHRLVSQFSADDAIRDVATRLGGADWTHYLGALTEIEIAGRMKRRGLPVTLISPNGARSSPDFKVVLKNRPVTFECTALNDTQAETKANAVMAALFEYPRAHPEFRGTVQVHFAESATSEEAHGRFNEITLAIRETAATGRPTSVDGICTVQPVVSDGPPAVVPNGGLVVGDGAKGVVQLMRALRQKARRRQVRGHDPAVIAVRLKHLWALVQQDIHQLIPALGVYLSEWLAGNAPDISGIIVVEEWRERFPGLAEFSGESFRAIRNQDEDGSVRIVLFAENPDASRPLTKGEIARVVGRRMVW